jgi:hypothetical protein
MAKRDAVCPSSFAVYARTFVANEDSVLFPRGHVTSFKNDDLKREFFLGQKIGFGVSVFRVPLTVKVVSDETASRMRAAVNAAIPDSASDSTTKDPDEDDWVSKRDRGVDYAVELGAGGRVGLYSHLDKNPTHNFVVVSGGAPRRAYDEFEAYLEQCESRAPLVGATPFGLATADGPRRGSGASFESVRADFERLEHLALKNRCEIARRFAEAIQVDLGSSEPEYDVAWNVLRLEARTFWVYYSDASVGPWYTEYGSPFGNVTVSSRSETVYELQDCFGGLPCVRKFDTTTMAELDSDTQTRHFTLTGYVNPRPASVHSTWSSTPALDEHLTRQARVDDVLVLGPLIVRHARRAYDDAVTVDASRRRTLEYFFATPERDEVMRAGQI